MPFRGGQAGSSRMRAAGGRGRRPSNVIGNIRKSGGGSSRPAIKKGSPRARNRSGSTSKNNRMY